MVDWVLKTNYLSFSFGLFQFTFFLCIGSIGNSMTDIGSSLFDVLSPRALLSGLTNN